MDDIFRSKRTQLGVDSTKQTNPKFRPGYTLVDFREFVNGGELKFVSYFHSSSYYIKKYECNHDETFAPENDANDAKPPAQWKCESSLV